MDLYLVDQRPDVLPFVIRRDHDEGIHLQDFLDRGEEPIQPEMFRIQSLDAKMAGEETLDVSATVMLVVRFMREGLPRRAHPSELPHWRSPGDRAEQPAGCR